MTSRSQRLRQFILEKNLTDTTCRRIRYLFKEETGIDVSPSLVSQQRAKADGRGRANRFAMSIIKRTSHFSPEDKKAVIGALQKDWVLF